ncbi:MAG: hypothetical protein ACE5PV_02285 [Candidatus Poribacteria bacterium]
MCALKYEIDLEGCKIFYELDLPEGYYGMSGADSIHLGKSAFLSEERLGRALVHEREHLHQHRQGVFANAVDAMIQQALDSEAYRAEDDWAELWSFGRRWQGVEY